MSALSAGRSGQDRRVVVTEEAGLAQALARGLIAGGARVAILAPKAEVAGLGPARKVDCEFGSPEEIRAALAEVAEQLGGIDQFVHAWIAPGLLEPTDFNDLSEDTWVGGCEASLEGAWWLVQQAFVHLRAGAGASVVFVVPTVGMSGAAHYTMLATVAEGLRAMAKSCGRCWGEDHVTVNVVATAAEQWLSGDFGDALVREIALAVPALGGPGDAAADLAPLVGLLGDPEAHFLTAATLVADGGVWMGL